VPFTILYIEEDESSRKSMTKLLEKFTTKIISVVDREEAYEKFITTSIDLIITDLKTPKFEGMNFISNIRSIDKEVPIIIVSTYNDIETLHASIECGIQGFIVKPIEVKKLTSLIHAIIYDHQNKSRIINNIKKINTNDFLEYGENKLIDRIDSFNQSTVLLIKIEEFKYLNNSLTSKISKKLQKRFAKRLLARMQEKCSFSKIYLLERGEFAFTKAYSSSDTLDEVFHQNVKDFQENINSAKIKIGLVDYTLSIIMSLAYGDNTLENAKAGLRALLQQKQSFIIANELLEKEKEFAVKKLQTFKMLKTAINNYNIISFFQPIVNNRTKKIEKYESLVRLIDEENNIISPYYFLDTAKEGKYYQEISSIVLRNSFRALFDTDMEISINLSSLDIEEQKTQEEFFSLLEKYNSDCNRITVELTEDERINDIACTQQFLKKIKERGVKVAIDDFGSGFSNFSRVLMYQPDYIKIDGTLIRDIEHNHLSKSMVETIVYFSKKQGIKTIAEYVENENIYNILSALGVDYSQGYYFGKAESLKREFI